MLDLCANHPKNQERLGRLGACRAVAGALLRFPSDPDVQCKVAPTIYPPPVWNRPILLTRRSLGSIHCPTGRGCGAVAYLSDNHAPNQRELVEADVVRALAAAMQGESVLHEVH